MKVLEGLSDHALKPRDKKPAIGEALDTPTVDLLHAEVRPLATLPLAVACSSHLFVQTRSCPTVRGSPALSLPMRDDKRLQPNWIPYEGTCRASRRCKNAVTPVTPLRPNAGSPAWNSSCVWWACVSAHREDVVDSDEAVRSAVALRPQKNGMHAFLTEEEHSR